MLWLEGGSEHLVNEAKCERRPDQRNRRALSRIKDEYSNFAEHVLARRANATLKRQVIFPLLEPVELFCVP